MRSVILERLLKGAEGARVETGFGVMGAYGERYEPETRKHFVDAYFDRVWTHRCIDLISMSATQVEMQVRRGEDWSDEHDLIDLLKRPNPRDPALMFFDWTLRWAEMIGEWYWELVPSRRGGIAELFPLRGHLVRVEPGGDGYVKGYVYDPNEHGIDVVEYAAPTPGKPVVKGAEGRPVLLAGRYASPRDDYYGMGPLRAAKDDIVSEYYGVRYDHRFFRNSARPDVVIGFKGKQDEDQRKANKAEWKSFQGVDRAHRAAVMDGDPNIHVLSQNQKDVEYLEGRRLSREGQCAAFGVPPVLVGDLTRATYSNYETSEYIFWKGTMLPKLEFFATWVNYVLLPYFPDVDEFGWDISEITALQKAEGWRSERIRGEVDAGLLTPNEGRELLDREASEEDGADSLWRPTKSRPINIASEQPKPEPGAPSPPDAPPPPPPTDPAAVPDAQKAASSAGLTVREGIATLHKATVVGWIRNAAEAKQRFADRALNEIAKHFKEQGARVMAIVEGQEKAAELERLLSEYGWAEDAVDFHTIVEAMQAGLAVASFKVTAAAIDHEAGYGLAERVLRELANRPDGIQSVSGRVKAEVLDEVQKGIEHGLTYRQIATGGTFKSAQQGAEEITIKGIKGVYDEYTGWQAERIARTEAGVTFNRSSAALMHEAGLGEVDIIDGDEDEGCAEWNGERKTLAEYEAEPLGHPNCTRIGLPVIEGTSAE